MWNFIPIHKYFAVITCYIGAYSIMFILGYSSPTQKQLVQEKILGYYSLSLFAGIVYVTKLFGYMLCPFLVQTNWSNNLIAVGVCVIGGVGWLLVIFAQSSYTLISGIGLVGFYSGVITVVINSYVAEISLEQERSVLSAGIGFTMRIGLLMAFSIGIVLSFRWLAVVGLCSVVLFAFLMFFTPHSPVWFVRRGLHTRAVDTLHYLHGNNFDANTEIQNITNMNGSAQFSIRDSLNALKDLKILKPILIVSVYGILEEFGGHPAMVALSTHILEAQHGMNPKIAALFYPIFLIIGAFISLCVVGKWKLKWQFILSESLQAISHLLFSIYYFVSEQLLVCNEDYSHICHKISFWPIFNIALYAFAFGFGFGSILYSLTGMMYSSHRELSFSITGVVLNISCFIVILLFYFLLHLIGSSLTFLLFTIIHVVTAIYLYVFIDI